MVLGFQFDCNTEVYVENSKLIMIYKEGYKIIYALPHKTKSLSLSICFKVNNFVHTLRICGFLILNEN